MPIFRSLSHLLAALFTNRADFHRRWKNPGAAQRWEGEWVSAANGHRGALKCLLTKTAADDFEAGFHAVYAGFLTVCYGVTLHGGQADGKLKLEGEADLGALSGGVYHYTGEADENSFNCAYRCQYDHGIFRLERLRP